LKESLQNAVVKWILSWHKQGSYFLATWASTAEKQKYEKTWEKLKYL
jgi:hypothetical protein